MIKIKRINDLAKIPARANPTDAGADLFSVEECVIPPLSRKLIKTGIILEIPDYKSLSSALPMYYGRIAPRSGLAFKHGIDVMAGVIDSSYRGEIGVILYNTDKDNEFKVSVGDRIAQLIIESHHNFDFVEVQDLTDTSRGDGGFGSTGGFAAFH
jgi:dUTP pyrophosphatase